MSSKRYLLINLCAYVRKKRGRTFETTLIRGNMRNVKCNSAGDSVLSSVFLTKSLMLEGFCAGGVYLPAPSGG